MKKYVNVYEVTQAYGGPEEGGWWYTHREPICSKPVRKLRKTKRWVREFKSQYLSRGTEGQILGVLPGHENDFNSTQDFEENDTTGLDIGYMIEVVVENHPARATPRQYYS